jgi:hypothetical protein
MGRETQPGRLARALLLAFSVALLGAANASAFTMGSNLGRDPDVSLQSTGDLVTVSNPILSGGLVVGGRLATYFSPVDGKIVRWRIRTGDADTGPVALRLIRPGSLSLSVPRTGAGTSAVVTPALGTISTYEVSMPIHRGDELGLNCCAPDPGQFFATISDPNEIAELAIWGDPPLADDGPLRLADDSDFLELAMNADIEPTSTFTIASVRQQKKHRLRVSGTFPNPGMVLGGDPRDRSLSTGIGEPPRRGLLFRTSGRTFGGLAGQHAPYAVSFLIRPTKKALRILRAQGKLAGRLKFAYTPAYGSVVTQTTKFRLTN